MASNINDARVEVGRAKVTQMRPRAKSQGADQDREAPWTDQLQRTKGGKPYAHERNAMIAMRHAPEWQGLLAFDEFSGETMALRETPWGKAAGRWNETDDTNAAIWMQEQGINVRPDTVARSVEAAARENRFHPVRQYLDALKWDGKPRLNTWLVDYFGAEDNRYSQAVAAKWLIAGVARIYKPGCKVDTALVLEGAQGARKSTALATLALREEWFTDRVEQIGSKDAVLAVQGKLIVELAELETVTGKQEVGAVKAFLSRQNDRMRPPYGRRMIDAQRQCIFAGSVNEVEYLRDATGGRRFWPVKCGAIDVEQLRAAREQLWAEAVTRYRNGEKWWLDDPELVAAAREEQAARYQGDVWEERIAEFISDRDAVSISDVLTALDVATGRQTQAEKNRVAKELTRQGWIRKQARIKGGGQVWRYHKPSPV